jgi:hypothetical protein
MGFWPSVADSIRSGKGVNHCAVLPQCSTWRNQKGSQKRGSVSGYGAGLRCLRRRLPMSKKESDQKTVKGSHQHSSSIKL